MGLSEAATEFVTVRHLATLTTLRPDGSPHVTPVAFTWDAGAGVARVTCRRTSRKARNAAAGGGSGRAVLCQVEGRRWVSLEGTVRVADDPAVVADAVVRYARRYERTPRPDPERVVLEVVVDRVLASADLR